MGSRAFYIEQKRKGNWCPACLIFAAVQRNRMACNRLFQLLPSKYIPAPYKTLSEPYNEKKPGAFRAGLLSLG